MTDKYRMYGWVPGLYLSDKQIGIQFQHAVTEYGLFFNRTKEYEEWAKHHKTSIVLNAYSTNSNPEANPVDRGIQNVQEFLNSKGITNMTFVESSLNDAETCVVAVLPNMYYNKEYDKYTSFYHEGRRVSEPVEVAEYFIKTGGPVDIRIVEICQEIFDLDVNIKYMVEDYETMFIEWLEIKNWLSQFRLA